MVETITPAVHGGSRRRYAGAVAAHVGTAGLAAAAVGALLGGAGRLVGTPWDPVGPALLGATALVYALAEGGGIAVPTLAVRRQVPEWWRTFFSPPSAAALYGAGLGVGFATSLSHGTYVVVCTAALLSGDPLAGALLCGPFGLTRAAASAVGGARDPAGVVDRLDALATTRLPRALNGAALATLAVAALTS